MKLNEWLSNKEVRRQVIWWTIGVGFFLIPLLYAVIANDFSSKMKAALEAGLEISGFAIIGILIGSVIIYNVKVQAVEDVRDSKKEIDDSFNDLYNRKKLIKQDKIPDAMIYIDDNNALCQLSANESLTIRTITKKKNKLVVAQIKGNQKKITSLNADIKNLENNEMYDRKFKGLKHKDVLQNDVGLFSSETTYRKKYVDKPTSTNWWLKIITTPLKFLTLGGSLVSSMVLGISWQSLALFYLSTGVLTAISSLLVYILITRRVVNKTFKANTNMIAYIDAMLLDIGNGIPQQKETVKKDVVLEIGDKEVKE